MHDKITVLAVGDLILDTAGVEQCFDESKRILNSGDIVIGQVEVPHTDRGTFSVFGNSVAPAAPIKNLACMKDAGFNIATTAGNHVFDQGLYGVIDTRAELEHLGLQVTGSGKDIEEARKPAVVETKMGSIACFSYNCVGPRESWASALKPGAAFIRTVNAYDTQSGLAALPKEIYTIADPGTMELMRRDFEKAKSAGQRILACFHLGRMVFPELLQCQRQITHFAIDCGAQAVFCTHPHTLQGIEIYKEKPIYYSLGNFITLTDAFVDTSTAEKQHKFKPFDYPGINPTNVSAFKPDKGPDPRYIFGDISRMTGIAKVHLHADGRVEAGIIPCIINADGHPVPVSKKDGGEKVKAHLESLNRTELLGTCLQWNLEGTELLL